jgi:hypothetical protein
MFWLEWWLNAGASAIAIALTAMGVSIYLNACIKRYREQRQQTLAHERKLHEDYARLFGRDEKFRA